jgi:flavin-dependent dehydrogenase
MSCAVDMLVIGGGPAGAAAAIWGAQRGLRVTLMERCAFPRHRPGETLHPGLEPIFKQLGVEGQVAAASGVRHSGQSVVWAENAAFLPFGYDADGSWKGYQILRENLDAILLMRAREIGVTLLQPQAAGEPIIHEGRVVGVRMCENVIARYVLDATGARAWLSRHLSLAVNTASPRLHAYYGYCEGEIEEDDAQPSLVGDRMGWTWTAQIGPQHFHWTRLTFDPLCKRIDPPPRLAKLRNRGRVRGADVTWRHVPASAGAGYFLVGEAAVVLDPAGSHGVLRALMSGMMVAHAIADVLSGSISESTATSQYRAWMADWFEHDVQYLAAFYRRLCPMSHWPIGRPHSDGPNTQDWNSSTRGSLAPN